MKKIYIGVIILLSVVVLYQSRLLNIANAYAGQEKPQAAKKYAVPDLPKFVEELQKKFNKDLQSNGQAFDRFFNKAYVAATKAPLKAMEELRKKLSKSLGQDSAFLGRKSREYAEQKANKMK